MNGVSTGFGPIDGNFTTNGGYVYNTLIHEMGHMLGLGHGGAYNAGGTCTSRGAIDPKTGVTFPYVNQGTFDPATYPAGGVPFSGMPYGWKP